MVWFLTTAAADGMALDDRCCLCQLMRLQTGAGRTVFRTHDLPPCCRPHRLREEDIPGGWRQRAVPGLRRQCAGPWPFSAGVESPSHHGTLDPCVIRQRHACVMRGARRLAREANCVCEQRSCPVVTARPGRLQCAGTDADSLTDENDFLPRSRNVLALSCRASSCTGAHTSVSMTPQSRWSSKVHRLPCNFMSVQRQLFEPLVHRGVGIIDKDPAHLAVQCACCSTSLTATTIHIIAEPEWLFLVGADEKKANFFAKCAPLLYAEHPCFCCRCQPLPPAPVARILPEF